MMLELQILCATDTALPSGNPWRDFSKTGHHVEHFDSWEALELRRFEWAKRGVTTRLGRLTQRLHDSRRS